METDVNDEQKRIVRAALVDANHLAECCANMMQAMNRHHAAVELGEIVDETDIEACANALIELEQAEADVSEYMQAIRRASYEYKKRSDRAWAELTANAQAQPTACRSEAKASGSAGAPGWAPLPGDFSATFVALELLPCFVDALADLVSYRAPSRPAAECAENSANYSARDCSDDWDERANHRSCCGSGCSPGIATNSSDANADCGANFLARIFQNNELRCVAFRTLGCSHC